VLCSAADTAVARCESRLDAAGALPACHPGGSEAGAAAAASRGSGRAGHADGVE
jgi:hypothetical protein